MTFSHCFASARCFKGIVVVGLHSPSYLQCALVLQHPDAAAELGRALADQLRGAGATVVLSPALGGLIIGHEVARALGCARSC
jgi:orotate phosphoribosyltransferase